jgi:membrane-associated protein
MPLALLSPTSIVESAGILGVALVVFMESGLLVGFLLPGDSLLFTAGFFASAPASVPASLHLSLAPLIAAVVLAAVAGDQLGYLIGRRAGPALYRRPDGRIFRRAHLDRAEALYEHHGPKTIVLARFIPVVRTFAPLVAGATGMPRRRFSTYNAIGGVAWGTGMPILGYFLGQVQVIADHLELAVLSVIALSLTPVVIEALRARRAPAPHAATADQTAR